MTIACVSGYFDPIHIGHIEYFKNAKNIADKLMVIVNNDEQAKLKKGKAFMPADERVKIIQELKSRNISDWNINKALGQISETEYNDKLKKLCEKRIDSSDNSTPNRKDKIIRSLTYKGWEIDKVVSLVNQLIK